MNSKLKGRGVGVKYNTQRESGNVLLTEGRNLQKYFGNLTATQYTEIYNKYFADLEMYGYTIDNATFVAKCGEKGQHGDKCC